MSTDTRHRPAALHPMSHRLESSLVEWEHAGLIEPAQADAIRWFEHQVAATAATSPAPAALTAPASAGPPAARRVPVVAEALGYLGGMLGVIGAVLLTAGYWDTMNTASRLGIAVSACAVLVLSGALVPRRGEPALERLRSFLWFGATAAGALAGGVFAHEVVHADSASAVVLSGASVVAALSLVLWRQHQRPVQQATFIIGTLVMVGTLAGQWLSAETAGLVVWVVAALFLASGIAHFTTTPWITVGTGATGMVVGAALTGGDMIGPSLLFWTATAAMLVALAMIAQPVRDVADRVVLYVVGGVGLFQSIAPTVVHFGHRAGIATGLVVIAIGAALLLLAHRPFVRAQVLAQVFAGLLLVGGAAITGMQSAALATTLGLAMAVGLIVLGTVPGFVLMSIFGCLGLLVNVPWAIGYWFPGEGRAPLLIAVSGLLIVLVAVWLTHQGGELRHTFRHRHS